MSAAEKFESTEGSGFEWDEVCGMVEQLPAVMSTEYGHANTSYLFLYCEYAENVQRVSHEVGITVAF